MTDAHRSAIQQAVIEKETKEGLIKAPPGKTQADIVFSAICIVAGLVLAGMVCGGFLAYQLIEAIK